MSEMAYFENQLLEPFMHVRVSDTPANKKVQEVSFIFFLKSNYVRLFLIVPLLLEIISMLNQVYPNLN